MITWLQNLLPSRFSASKSAANTLQNIAAQPSLQTTSQTPSVDEASKTAAPLRSAKLIMVTPDNNNKYYDMAENTDGTFTVTYGRVGAKAATVTYPMTQWDAKINEKIRKGYKNQTHLFAVGTDEVKEDALDLLDCEAVKSLLRDLMQYAKQSIKHNYVVTADKVTKQQVQEAQDLLDALVETIKKGMNIELFNQKLIELYQVIPRRMSNVREHLAKPETALDDLEKMLAEEQATLDVMRGQVEINEKQKSENADQPTQPLSILEMMGIGIETVKDEKVNKLIKTMMGDDKGRFKRAFMVINYRNQNNFNNFLSKSSNKNTTLFWHGSRNENWLSILKTGLVLRPANAVITGKMFGYGLYFADKCRKSLNYTSIYGSYWARGNSQKAYLAIYEVHTGQQLKISRHDSWCTQLNATRLKERGAHYDSVFAEGGFDLLNNEFIVYNENQCAIKYLVEIQ